MVKVIGQRYKKYDKQNNWPYPSTKSNFFNNKSVQYKKYNTMQQCFFSPFSRYIIYINNTQGNELASHGKGQVPSAPSQNNYSRSFETPRKNNFTSPTNNSYKPK